MVCGANVKPACTLGVTGVPLATVSDFVTDAEPLARVTVSVTLYVPVAAYLWPGIVAVEVPPSPKLHAHAVTQQLDSSLKTIVSLVVGFAGVQLKLAPRGLVTVTLFDVVLVVLALLTLSVTVNVPAVV
jgi:hypothetical protein